MKIFKKTMTWQNLSQISLIPLCCPHYFEIFGDLCVLIMISALASRRWWPNASDLCRSGTTNAKNASKIELFTSSHWGWLRQGRLFRGWLSAEQGQEMQPSCFIPGSYQLKWRHASWGHPRKLILCLVRMMVPLTLWEGVQPWLQLSRRYILLWLSLILDSCNYIRHWTTITITKHHWPPKKLETSGGYSAFGIHNL